MIGLVKRFSTIAHGRLVRDDALGTDCIGRFYNKGFEPSSPKTGAATL